MPKRREYHMGYRAMNVSETKSCPKDIFDAKILVSQLADTRNWRRGGDDEGAMRVTAQLIVLFKVPTSYIFTKQWNVSMSPLEKYP